MRINSKLLVEKIKESGYTQKRYAEALEIAPSTLNNVLSGRTRPSHYVMEQSILLLNLSAYEHLQIFFALTCINNQTEI